MKGRDGMTLRAVTIGPLRFRFDRDGDDPGEGWIVIESRYERVRVQATRDDWRRFEHAARMAA